MQKQIQSVSHPYVKALVSLRLDKKTREAKGTLLVSGVKLITDLARKFPIKTLFVLDTYDQKIPFHAEETFAISLPVLKKITGLVSPEAFAAEIKIPKSKPLASLKRLLVLDRLQDPGNVGTLFRTALALNWDGIFLLEPTVDPFNDKALRASQGASLELPFQGGSLENLLALVAKENLSLCIATAKGALLSSMDPPKKIALALGSEAHGVQDLLLKAGTPLAIPIHHVDSLNVAIAGGILMYALGKHV